MKNGEAVNMENHDARMVSLDGTACQNYDMNAEQRNK
jgi:hypothetical protein